METTSRKSDLEGAVAIDGLTTIKSSLRPKETMDRLEAQVKARGMSVFARIDHAAGAATIGMQLRPTEVLIFGNPTGGTPVWLARRHGISGETETVAGKLSAALATIALAATTST
jgi:Domain of unknown function DUF302